MFTKVQIADREFSNPIIAASGCFGFGREYAKFYDLGALGGISCKGLTLEPREGNFGCRVAETPSGMLNCVGLQNPGVRAFVKDELPFMQQYDTNIIANISGFSEAEYIESVQIVSQSSVHMIELNISCPNVKNGGQSFGIEPKTIEHIVGAVKKVCKKPLIVKLSPNVSSIGDNAMACQNAGADAVSLINTVGGMMVDIYTRRPVLGNIFGGLSGPCIMPIALKMVYEVFKRIKIPIIGMGGISSASDVIAFMLCGATAVQVGTANFSCPTAAFDIAKDLTIVMKKCKINNILDIVGKLEV